MNGTVYIISAIILWNIITFSLYGIDKRKAIRNKWRISETTLIVCAFLMGGVGALLGMCFFHHKTRHTKFRLLIPLSIAVNVIIAVCCIEFGGLTQESAAAPRDIITDDALASTELAAPPAPTQTPTPTQGMQTVLPQTDEEIDDLLAGIFTYNNLLYLSDLNAGFIFNITYATEANFLGVALYDMPLCLAHADLARALLKAQAKAAEQGLCLIIYDAYRPMSDQQAMYDLTPEGQRAYVAKPGPSANHPKGVAVDCSLAYANADPLPMPSGYDEFSKRASVSYTGGTEEERANRDLLINIMKDSGLKVSSGEWWHFSLSTASDYTGMDISFDEFLSERLIAYATQRY